MEPMKSLGSLGEPPPPRWTMKKALVGLTILFVAIFAGFIIPPREEPRPPVARTQTTLSPDQRYLEDLDANGYGDYFVSRPAALLYRISYCDQAEPRVVTDTLDRVVNRWC